jgi:primosomal protein N'
MAEMNKAEREPLFCPTCEVEAPKPLVCGDCGAVICRQCGTPLEKIDELGIA